MFYRYLIDIVKDSTHRMPGVVERESGSQRLFQQIWKHFAGCLKVGVGLSCILANADSCQEGKVPLVTESATNELGCWGEGVGNQWVACAIGCTFSDSSASWHHKTHSYPSSCTWIEMWEWGSRQITESAYYRKVMSKATVGCITAT